MTVTRRCGGRQYFTAETPRRRVFGDERETLRVCGVGRFWGFVAAAGASMFASRTYRRAYPAASDSDPIYMVVASLYGPDILIFRSRNFWCPEGRRYPLSVQSPGRLRVQTRGISLSTRPLSHTAVRPFTGLQRVQHHLICNASWPGSKSN